MMAYDKELRPDNRLSQSVYHGASSEGSLSPDTRCVHVCMAEPRGMLAVSGRFGVPVAHSVLQTLPQTFVVYV